MRRSVDLARAARPAGRGRAGAVGGRLGRAVRRCAGGRVRVPGRYGRSVRELAAWHRPRLEALAEAGPDVLALETVPDTDEAEALMTAIAGLGIPAWLSYTIASDGPVPGSRWARRSRSPPVCRRWWPWGQLLRASRRADGHRRRPRGDGHAGDRLSQQRRGVGRPAACLDGAVPLLLRTAAAVGRSGSEDHRRVLPGPSRRHRRDRRGRS
jgi:hypothetical protein